jgi:soluble lytic murein transglycosylase-like protein
MTLPQNCRPSVIPLFGQNTGHSSVPAKVCTALARSGSQGRPSGRRASAMAALRSLGTMLCFVMILASSMLSSGAAHAGRVSPPTPKASSETLHPFAAFVTEASRRFSVPEHWIRAVMRVESSEKPRARSRKGAIGLMQIMPTTWDELRARHGLGTDPYDPRDNILAGAAYIRELSNRYGAPGFLAAYNAGPRRYERHLATGRPLPVETQAYVATLAPMTGVGRIGGKVVTVAQSFPLARSPLFVVRIASNLAASQSSPGARSGRPSSVRTVVDLSALLPHSGNLFVRRTSQVRSQ